MSTQSPQEVAEHNRRERAWRAPKLPAGRPYDGAVLDKDGRLVLPWGKPHPADGVRKP